MRAIRSLLWIGPGSGLADCAVCDAPTLDVTWSARVDEALALPPMGFDGGVLEGVDLPSVKAALARLLAWEQAPPILLCLRSATPDEQREALALGARGVVVTGPAGGLAPQSPTPLLEQLLQRVDALARERAAPSPCDRGDAPPRGARCMHDVEALVQRACDSNTTVLLSGETGTGKEVTARRIHRGSRRARNAFVAINCSALPESLLESELFGYRKGAFSGADRDRTGLFEQAHRGTLFLDEIGETSAALQVKLLRVLQEREVLPLGGQRPHPIDVRVIAASNRALPAEVEAGRFREDLYYRLAVFPIALPPLRARSEDIPGLAAHFLARYGELESKPDCRFSPAALRLLVAYAWPGNVRELENEVQRALAMAAPGEVITARGLSPKLHGVLEAVQATGSRGETLREAMDRVEAWLIRRALEHNQGRRAATARKLGITREGLYKKMKRLGVE